MPAQIVPLTTNPNQSLAITLQVDGSALTLQLSVSYSKAAGYWVLAIADQSGNLLLDSIPMICGYYPASNILQQYAYLEIGSAYIINVSGVAQDSPDDTNLGSDFQLLWSDTPTS
jgi:hypothetical protein